jgi:mycoredoxin-dependent peroxiredoxin
MKTAPAPPALKVGDAAPDFKLQYFDGHGLKDVSLQDYRGKKNVVLAFYIFAFTGGWTQQMKNFQQNLAKLEAADTQVLGVSMDSPFANKAFADQIGVTFPLLSDWGGDVTHKYGVYVDEYKAARRINFLIGKDGKILEEQLDKEAIDPTKIVDACQRPRVNRWTVHRLEARRGSDRLRKEPRFRGRALVEHCFCSLMTKAARPFEAIETSSVILTITVAG